MKSCQNCKHGDNSACKPPCEECIDTGNHENWEPVEGTLAAKVKEFLEKCDEMDAAIHTGDILLDMKYHERAEFVDFLVSWFDKFARISCNEKEEMENKK